MRKAAYSDKTRNTQLRNVWSRWPWLREVRCGWHQAHKCILKTNRSTTRTAIDVLWPLSWCERKSKKYHTEEKSHLMKTTLITYFVLSDNRVSCHHDISKTADRWIIKKLSFFFFHWNTEKCRGICMYIHFTGPPVTESFFSCRFFSEILTCF